MPDETTTTPDKAKILRWIGIGLIVVGFIGLIIWLRRKGASPV